MALANWARSDTPYPSFRNDVHVVQSSDFAGAEHSAVHDEKKSNPDLAKACDATAQRWRDQLDTEFNVATKAPFVILGDLPKSQLEQHYRDIVLPTTAAIQATYTTHALDEPVVLMLFSTEASYRRHARQLFGQRNASVYGFYKPSNRTVVINLESGLGTLVHELTHAAFDFDFDEMPLWLNEGIASLHEQATFTDDNTGADNNVAAGNARRIRGEINWRYPILRDAITSNRLNSIEHLLTDNEGFRGTREGVNYAHARYLCMYLQQKNQLLPLYKSLRDGDRETADAMFLKARFPDQTWAEINDDFRKWALELKAPAKDSTTKPQGQ